MSLHGDKDAPSPIVKNAPNLVQRLRENTRDKGAIGKTLIVSTLNQAVSSGTNFVLGLYLVRTLAPADFGMYGIGFAISLFYGGIGSALFLVQMVVHLPEKASVDRLPFAARMFTSVLLFCIGTLLAVAAVLSVGMRVSATVAQYTAFGLGVIASSTGYLLKDFFVRHCFSIGREAGALLVNVVTAGALILILIFCSRSGREINHTDALLIYATSNLAGAMSGVARARLPLRNVALVDLKNDLKTYWRGGLWSVAVHVIYTVRTQIYILIVAGLIGPIGVARINAARFFVTPVTVLVQALSQLLLPRMARAVAVDGVDVDRLASRFGVLVAGIVTIYSAFVIASYDSLAASLLGEKYESVFALVVGWCCYSLLSAVKGPQETGLMARRLFKKQAQINAWAAIFSLLAVSALIPLLSESGVMIGLSLSELLVICMLFRYARGTRQDRGQA